MTLLDAAPKLPLTPFNAVLAVCALTSGLYPGHGVPPRRIVLSVGLMNLAAVKFSATPMCHGADSLAGTVEGYLERCADAAVAAVMSHQPITTP